MGDPRSRTRRWVQKRHSCSADGRASATSLMPVLTISIVQQLVAHASATTTAKYDRRVDRLKRDAAALLRFPHVPF